MRLDGDSEFCLVVSPRWSAAMGRARATFATGRIAISPTMLKRHGTAIAAIDRTRTSKFRNSGWMGKYTSVLLRPPAKNSLNTFLHIYLATITGNPIEMPGSAFV